VHGLRNIFLIRASVRVLLHGRKTKNFRRQIRTRDQKYNVGIGVRGWILKERCRRRRTGSFHNYVLIEQKNADGVEQFSFRDQTHFIHQFADRDHICFDRME
jgi:hypothetical protein